MSSAHWRQAAAVFMAGGLADRAEAALRRAVELDPGDARGRLELARVLRAVGKGQEAVDHLDPIFDALAPGIGTIPRTPNRMEHEGEDARAEKGYIHAGPAGAGPPSRGWGCSPAAWRR